MGFNRWPPDITEQAVGRTDGFIAEHGDLLLHHSDNGVPWPESLDDAPFSDHVMDDWENARAATPERHRVFVALTPIAVAETGMPSRAFTAGGVRYEFEPADQTQYVDLLLRSAAEHKFEFVVNWAPIDFDPMLRHFDQQVADLARYWAYTGLERSDGCPKPALAIWEAYLALPRR